MNLRRGTVTTLQRRCNTPRGRLAQGNLKSRPAWLLLQRIKVGDHCFRSVSFFVLYTFVFHSFVTHSYAILVKMIYFLLLLSALFSLLILASPIEKRGKAPLLLYLLVQLDCGCFLHLPVFHLICIRSLDLTPVRNRNQCRPLGTIHPLCAIRRRLLLSR